MQKNFFKQQNLEQVEIVSLGFHDHKGVSPDSATNTRRENFCNIYEKILEISGKIKTFKTYIHSLKETMRNICIIVS